MMDDKYAFRNLRSSTGMTQVEFSKHMHIPVSTYAKWEQGISSPPGYVFGMMKKLLQMEGKIKDEQHNI